MTDPVRMTRRAITSTAGHFAAGIAAGAILAATAILVSDAVTAPAAPVASGVWRCQPNGVCRLTTTHRLPPNTWVEYQVRRGPTRRTVITRITWCQPKAPCSRDNGLLAGSTPAGGRP